MSKNDDKPLEYTCSRVQHSRGGEANGRRGGSAPPQRGFAARIGICLLNLWQPGLGLIRLSAYRGGFSMIAGVVALIVAITAFYAFGPRITYERYLVLLAIVAVMVVCIYGTAIVLSWRRSKAILPRNGRLWQWYGVLGVGIAATALWQLLPSSRSYYQSYYAASASMVPTLEKGDRLLAQMRNHGPVRRGDIVIVRVGEVDYVSRVAGLPGDTIALVDGAVILNGKSVAQRLESVAVLWRGPFAGPARPMREQFPGETRAHVVLDSGPTPQDNAPDVSLGEGEYFILGDNRDHSLDSRFPPPMAPGIVTQGEIVGRALFRYWRSRAGLAEGRL